MNELIENKWNYAIGVIFALPFKTPHKNVFIKNMQEYYIKSLQWDPGIASKITILWFGTNSSCSEDHGAS